MLAGCGLRHKLLGRLFFLGNTLFLGESDKPLLKSTLPVKTHEENMAVDNHTSECFITSHYAGFYSASPRQLDISNKNTGHPYLWGCCSHLFAL
jgi:hypothetical protein